jgi:hypothetical protein
MNRKRSCTGFGGLILVTAMLTSCASPSPTPSATPVAACGLLTDIVWAAPVESDTSLTDVQVVQVSPDGHSIFEVSGFPLRSTLPPDLTSGELESLIGDFQLHHERPDVLGTAAIPLITMVIDWGSSQYTPGRYVRFAGGKAVSAPFSARCSGNGTSVIDMLHLWSHGEEGILECSVSAGHDPLASLAQAYCRAS